MKSSEIRKTLISEFINLPEIEWVEVNLSSSNLINMTIVSHKFKELGFEKREDYLEELLHMREEEFGFLYLYTPEEAELMEIKPHAETSSASSPQTWLELTQFALNNSVQGKKKNENNEFPRTVTFYSFKGGVGRTTALVHTGWILAMRGYKVLLVDLDLEAPSLHLLLNNQGDKPLKGLVEFLYERCYALDNAYQLHISDIFGEVQIENSSGRLFVIPAGDIDLNYIAKVDDLRVSALKNRDIWETFKGEVTKQLQPDFILVDSRTGINEWGAFSLLQAADDILAFMYPNEENYQGLETILGALKTLEHSWINSLNIVMSKVPNNKQGKDKAKELWKKLNDALTEPNEQNDEDDLESDEDQEPIIIHYTQDIALAEKYPIIGFESVFAPIANLIDEEAEQTKLRAVLSGRDRWEIIESLQFEVVDASDTKNDLSKVFQRTSDFDKFIDETTVVIHGQKGTGKTALYWMLLKHFDQSRKMSRGRLDNIQSISAHGSFRSRPGKEEFRYWANTISENGSWEAVWRGYLLIRLFMEKNLPGFRNKEFQEIAKELKGISKNKPEQPWKSQHTELVLKFGTDASLTLKIKDYLTYLNDNQKKDGKALWFFYDDLDEDIEEGSLYQLDALSGLYYFIRSCDTQSLPNLRFKTFIREDIWNRLNFTNKSHFKGRDVLLQWTRIDFLRLALRQALYSPVYSSLVSRYFPVQDTDNASEEILLDSLQILWGIRRENNNHAKYVARWVYERLTDATGTTFPRLLGLLLNAAKDHELQYREQPHVPAPSDRLLRNQSLNFGLISASKHRAQELRQEYPELLPVFDRLLDFPEICSKVKLEELVGNSLGSKDEVITKLQSIGLLQELNKGNEFPYRFADLYAHGFEMRRTRRKY